MNLGQLHFIYAIKMSKKNTKYTTGKEKQKYTKKNKKKYTKQK